MPDVDGLSVNMCVFTLGLEPSLSPLLLPS